jgi:hypothetical protein
VREEDAILGTMVGLALSADTLLVCCEGSGTLSNHLPLCGSQLAQLGLILGLAVVIAHTWNFFGRFLRKRRATGTMEPAQAPSRAAEREEAPSVPPEMIEGGRGEESGSVTRRPRLLSHHDQSAAVGTDNPDQRIAEDICDFVDICRRLRAARDTGT